MWLTLESLLLFSITHVAFAGGFFIQGTILNPDHVAIPGIKVSFTSALYISPVFTDSNGRFETVIPAVDLTFLYLQIYWNDNLMFSQPLRSLASQDPANWYRVQRDGIGEIILRPIVLGRSPNH
jgi:hypothetical protein